MTSCRGAMALFALMIFCGGATAVPRADGAGQGTKSAPSGDGHDSTAERAVVTRHEIDIGGHRYAYKAVAGTLTIRDGNGNADANMFYIAYIVDDGKRASARPITFLYSGGPGASSAGMVMGSFGPARVMTASPAATGPAPYRTVPNADSLLDKSDLVFIDAIGTGFSHGLPGEHAKSDKDANPDKRFWGTDQDINSFGRFIERYLTVNGRWNSPKFLLGVSYGTARSAGLAKYLEDHGIALNGVVLLSSILNYGRHLPGLDNDYVNLLPSYAAVAWYHHKIDTGSVGLEPFLDEVRRFARYEYSVALARGNDLAAGEIDALAQKLSRYTGLPADYLKKSNLRVSHSRFRKELLRDERRIIGRYDARFVGSDSDAAGENPQRDPSDDEPRGAFTAGFNDYLTHDLGYASQVPYIKSAPNIAREWDMRHMATNTARPEPLPLPIMISDLGDAMRSDPDLKILSLNGWFDLSTPFFATEYDLAHLDIDPPLRRNISFAYYPSGHLIYLDPVSLKQLKRDIAKFYDGAAKRGQ